ncbi:MAG: sel1 repeat family protein [Oxalobacter sp.]|nr:sel1 repeat family protein [Oxalobacter sp.]
MKWFRKKNQTVKVRELNTVCRFARGVYRFLLMLFFAGCASSLVMADELDLDMDMATYRPRLPELIKQAESGDTEKQFQLGILYAAGVEGQPDYEKAIYWYRKVAELDVPVVYGLLAVMYAEGLGASQDFVEAGRWAFKSAAKNQTLGKVMLGVFYEEGAGLKRNYKKAMEWYTSATLDPSNMGARYRIGMLYLEGKGVKQDTVQALDWLAKAAEHDDVYAIYQLGNLYYEGRFVKQNYVQALTWFEKAAATRPNPYRDSLSKLYGAAYVPGEAYTRTIAVMMKRDPGVRGKAAFMAGWMYEKGKGTGKDTGKARQYYRQAAEMGNEAAKEALANQKES